METTSPADASGPSAPGGGSGGGSVGDGSGRDPPRRFIYTPPDMEQFRRSSARRELLSFAQALGRSCADPSVSSRYRYDPSDPLVGLTPAAASMVGSLRCMAETWLRDVPPDPNARARFGNPAFRTWHGRLVSRSGGIVRAALRCHREHAAGGRKRKADAARGSAESGDGGGGGGGDYDAEVLRSCSEAGYAAASSDSPDAAAPRATDDGGGGDSARAREDELVEELRAYLHPSFGHPTRLDYGTGHESSFLIFLYGLCKIGCLGGTKDSPPPPDCLAPMALSVFSAYLSVTRGLQRDYMLEPAGSHGVWGLDDYHCLPFYFGACQLQGNQGDADVTPQSVHNADLLRTRGDDLMYLGCIRYVKELKPGVPFFESSPMLDDISRLPSWGRVSRGLLRLYEGEVLDKMPVVQHFEFGALFKATWTPSQPPREAPTRTFINGPGGEECIAPWAQPDPGLGPSNGSMPPMQAPWSRNPGTGTGRGRSGGLPPTTRAPWAK